MADFLKKLPAGDSGTSPSQETVGVGDFNRVVGVLNGTDGPVGANFFALNPAWADPPVSQAFLALNPKYGLHADGVTDDTALVSSLFGIVPSAGGELFFGTASIACATAPTGLKSNTLLQGVGQGSQLKFTGTGNFLDYTGLTQVRCDRMRFSTTNAGSSTLFNLPGVFRNSWNACIVDGTHSTATPQLSSTGFNFNANAGDNRLIDMDINNLGTAINSSTVMNYLSQSIVGTCNYGLRINSGSFAGGMSINQCTFVAAAANCTAHISVEVTANVLHVTNSWFEGCTKAIVLGSGTNGPYSVGLINVILAATTTDLEINAATLTLLQNVTLDKDSGQTPTELSINATNAPEGQAINLRSMQSFDLADSVFPAGWTVLKRGTLRLPSSVTGGLNLSGQLIAAGAEAHISNNGAYSDPDAGSADALKVSGGMGVDVLRIKVNGSIDSPTATGAMNIGGTNTTQINIGRTGQSVNFVRAAIALGGGAAPTLGTIGGSGPATAAQNGWMQVKIAGTDSWVPFWR